MESREVPKVGRKSLIEATKEAPPNESLIQAVELVSTRDAALDVGAGGLRDSRYLLWQGFKKVVALDRNPEMHTLGESLHDKRLQTVISTFQKYDFPRGAFDLVNAQRSLSFTPRGSFDEVFRKTKLSLKEQGIFVGSLFGPNHSWKDSPPQGLRESTFLSLEEVKDLLVDMKIVDLSEEEKDADSATGIPAHWHYIHFIARK